MINEKQFVENYGFFWNTTLPLSKFFLREVNRNKVKSDTDFLVSQINGRRWSFLSEVAFKVLKDSYEHEYGFTERVKVLERIRLVEENCRKLFKEYEHDEANLTAPLQATEIAEIIELSKRMKKFLNEYLDVKHLLISPKFIGCGMIETCYGDLLVNETLLEVKMVNRNFQLNDFKQLLVYCALNTLSNKYLIKNIGLYNPRKGKHIIYELDQFCLNISGKTSSILLGEIVEYISSGELSK